MRKKGSILLTMKSQLPRGLIRIRVSGPVLLRTQVRIFHFICVAVTQQKRSQKLGRKRSIETTMINPRLYRKKISSRRQEISSYRKVTSLAKGLFRSPVLISIHCLYSVVPIIWKAAKKTLDISTSIQIHRDMWFPFY